MPFVYETGVSGLSYNFDYPIAALSVNTIISAAGQKLAMVGQVSHPTVRTGTINIRKIRFRCGALTLNFAGGTEVRVSLQDISATAGPPYQPDGTQDQFYDFKTATTTLTANTSNITGNLSADRAVDLSADSFGDASSRWFAVVFEFNVFNASDSLIVNGVTYAGTLSGGNAGNFLINTATWATVNQRINNVVLECDDGSFAFLLPSLVTSGALPTTATVSSTGAIRRAGVKFKFPTTRKVDRAALEVAVVNGSDGRLVLYDSDGTTELASVDIDNDAVVSVAGNFMTVAFPPVTLLANTFYRFVFVGSTSTASSMNYFDVQAAGHLDGLYIGQNAHWTQHDGTNWTDTTTRQPFFGIGVCAFDSGVVPSYHLGVS